MQLYVINLSSFNILHFFPYSSNSILVTIHPNIVKYIVLTEETFSTFDYLIPYAIKSFPQSYINKNSEMTLKSSNDPSFYVITSQSGIILVDKKEQTQIWEADTSGITQSFNYIPHFPINQSNSSTLLLISREKSILFGLLGEKPSLYEISDIFFIERSSFYLDSTKRVLSKLNLNNLVSSSTNNNNNNNSNNTQNICPLEVFKSQTEIVGTIVLEDDGLAFATSTAIYCISSDLIMASKSLWSDTRIVALVDIGAPDAFGVICKNGTFGVCRASYQDTPDLYFYPNLHEEEITAIGSGNFAVCTAGKSGRVVLWESGNPWWKAAQSISMLKKNQNFD